MYDAIIPSAIPDEVQIVAGYDDGARSVWPADAWQRFANTPQVHICTWGPRHHGNCLDVETGDSIPADIPDWADDAMARGVKRPIIYCGKWAWPECRARAGNRPVQWWIADPTNVAHIPAGADACQWGWAFNVTGGDYDLSLCQPTFMPG